MKREIKPFGCDDSRIMELMSEVIRSAMIDYMREIPTDKSKMSEHQKSRLASMVHDKGTAKAFFESSRLFRLCQLDFDYLVDAYHRGLFKYTEGDDN